MKDLLRTVLGDLRRAGADYADARLDERRTQVLTVRNEQVSDARDMTSRGFGVRVGYRGAWGFAGSADLSPDNVAAVGAKALEMARAYAAFASGRTRLAEEPAVEDSWTHPFERDPFEVPLSEKVDLLLAATKAARSDRRVLAVKGDMAFDRFDKLFVSSQGSAIEQTFYTSGGGIEVVAQEGDETQRRSYPAMGGGDYSRAGYEFLDTLDLQSEAPRVGEEAVALLSAPECPELDTSLILEGSQVALQVHESCGHPAELDRVMGTEISLAGGSFLSTDKLGGFRYGSKLVNLVADQTRPGGLGTFGYDDEGVKARSTDIVRDGTFVGYLSSRETAPTVGLSASSGAMRADSWGRMPLIRMTNLSLEPGDCTLEELIADTDHGVYMATNKAWSIDDLRLNFHFGCEIAWEIKKGRKVRMLRNPAYTGITPRFWGGCDAVCNQDEWRLWGLRGCGKGEPMQVVQVGHGAAPARFRNVKIGVKK